MGFGMGNHSEELERVLLFGKRADINHIRVPIHYVGKVHRFIARLFRFPDYVIYVPPYKGKMGGVVPFIKVCPVIGKEEPGQKEDV